MVFRVMHVLNCNTFEVSPPWKCEDKGGIRVRAVGYTPPDEGNVCFRKVKNKLESLITGKEVELRNFRKVDYDCLVCDVYIEGKNLANHFSKYRD